MAYLNIQVIPAPRTDIPHGIVQRPGVSAARSTCANCDGRGHLTHGDRCFPCGGTGTLRVLHAARFEPHTESEIAAVSSLLESLDCRHRVQVTARCWEIGGGLTNTGRATIICGMHGERLQAIHGSPKCGARHSEFYVFRALRVDYWQHRDVGEGRVSVFGVRERSAERPEVGLVDAVLWRFTDALTEIDLLDEDLIAALRLTFPMDAVRAAQGKARDYHCRSAWFAKGEAAALGPSGALTGAGAAWGGLPSPMKGPGIGYDPVAP